MVSTEPELDSEGRPRHVDPRDNAVPPFPPRRRNFVPWLIGAVILVALIIVLMGP